MLIWNYRMTVCMHGLSQQRCNGRTMDIHRARNIANPKHVRSLLSPFVCVLGISAKLLGNKVAEKPSTVFTGHSWIRYRIREQQLQFYSLADSMVLGAEEIRRELKNPTECLTGLFHLG